MEMAQPEVMKRLDFVMVSINGTHPPIDMEDDTLPYPCQSGINTRLCVFNGSTRGQKFHEPRKQKPNVIGRVALCCFDC